MLSPSQFQPRHQRKESPISAWLLQRPFEDSTEPDRHRVLLLLIIRSSRRPLNHCLMTCVPNFVIPEISRVCWKSCQFPPKPNTCISQRFRIISFAMSCKLPIKTVSLTLDAISSPSFWTNRPFQFWVTPVQLWLKCWKPRMQLTWQWSWRLQRWIRWWVLRSFNFAASESASFGFNCWPGASNSR